MSLLETYFKSNVTRTLHGKPYPAINPSTRPELNHAGKTVLVTGGSTGIGMAIVKSFLAAQASTLIITGRVLSKVEEACVPLREKVAASTTNHLANTPQIIAMECDPATPSSINTLWDDLAARQIHVDVLVLNAARGPKAMPLLAPHDTFWNSFEINARSPVLFARRFHLQNKPEPDSGRKVEGPKALVNVSTAAIHVDTPIGRACPDYALSKTAGMMAMQMVADEVSPDDMQVVSFHPGVVVTGLMRQAIGDAEIPSDDVYLPGHFAVWAASKEARFLHGRLVWSKWDVDEMADPAGPFRQRIEKDDKFLRVGVVGLRDTNLDTLC